MLLKKLKSFLFRIKNSKKLYPLLKGYWYKLKLKKIGKSVYIYPGVKIFSPERVELENDVTLFNNVLIYGGAKGYVKIGNNSHVAPFSVINGEGGVKIGNKVGIGSGVKIYSISFNGDDTSRDIIDTPVKLKEVIIEDNVMIGANSVLIPGVKIGHGSIIGAGAVVIRDIPSNSIAVGVPAKVIKERAAKN